jgi:hypothetical protein
VLLLFNQSIRFVNGEIRSFFLPDQIAEQIRRYAIISRPDIASVKDLKGKRLAINTFGSSADSRSISCSAAMVSTPTKMSPCYRSPAARTPVSPR